GLESVTNVGQRATDNDRHRVVEIRLAHLLFNVDRLDVRRTGTKAASAVATTKGKLRIRILFVCHLCYSEQGEESLPDRHLRFVIGGDVNRPGTCFSSDTQRASRGILVGAARILRNRLHLQEVTSRKSH